MISPTKSLIEAPSKHSGAYSPDYLSNLPASAGAATHKLAALHHKLTQQRIASAERFAAAGEIRDAKTTQARLAWKTEVL